MSIWTSKGGAAALLCLALFALPGAVFFRAGMASLWRLWPFIAVIVIWHGLTGDLAQGVAIALRVLTAVGFACLVTMTTRLTDLMAVMTWLPSKMSSNSRRSVS